MREDRVGVVIPAFNAGEYLLEAAESAAISLGSKDNVVVVDDGSNDKLSLSHLSTLRESGYRVIRQKNQGVSVARNAGLALLGTPYAFVLDSDDRIGSSAPTAAADVLEKDPGVAIVAGLGIEFSTTEDYSEPLSPGLPTRDSMRHGSWIATASAFRVADWMTTGGFPVGVHIGEDWVFWMRLLKSGGKITVVDNIFVYRRRHPGQVTYGYIDPRENAKARNLVTLENTDLFLKYPDELFDELTKTRTSVAEYRYSRRNIEKFKSTMRRGLAVITSIRGNRGIVS